MKPVKNTEVSLNRRERQIFDILYARGPATVAEVQAALPTAELKRLQSVIHQAKKEGR